MPWQRKRCAAPDETKQDPRYHFLLARAYAPDDPARAQEEINAALEINPGDVDCHLMLADRLIDAEQYKLADEELAKIFDVNSNHPSAWAYKSVIAHLAGDTAGEAQAHQWALAHWPANPEVDYLIGEKLSQKYRFAEGAAYQRKALVLDRDYRPAKLQLSQDLLRLGNEQEGWKLADEVLEKDAYNVVAFNLVTLHDEISKFRTLRDDGFILRMADREADLYGDRALELLKKARETLCKKYDYELKEPITVEIFPRQQDFAVRTFGLPGADGFLGVCFGRVITANSPASQGDHPSNWEAVLWHEFCHVVTLHKTNNKMPRWLSEGISVYEEKQANPGWGQAMNAQYRSMILDGEMPPVSQLSSAFLSPKSPIHLQFAYFQSALVVEYIVDRFGLDALKKILDELGQGMEINEALVRFTVPLGQLDGDFDKYAREKAEKLAGDGTWEEVDLPASADSAAIAKWLEDHPKNILALRRLGRRLIAEMKYDEALGVAKKLLAMYPGDVEPDSGYAIWAAAEHGLGHIDGERQALDSLAKINGDITDANLRLIEIGEATGDWQGVAENARRLLAINPLIVTPHRAMAKAAEELGQREDAIRAYRALLLFDTADPAHAHFRLATLLEQDGKPAEAKRQVLMALDEAPAIARRTTCCSSWSRTKQAPRGQTTRPRIATQPRKGTLRSDHRRNSKSKRNRQAKSLSRASRLRPTRLPTGDSEELGCHMTTRKKITASAIVAALALASVGLAQRFGGGYGGYDEPVETRWGVPNWEVDPRVKHDVFTFARVQYSSDRSAYDDYGGYGGGRRGRRGGRGGGRFNSGYSQVGPPDYFGNYGRGWGTDGPQSDLDFSFRLHQLTSIAVNPNPVVLRLTDENLFDYPFLYMIEPGTGGLYLQGDEITALRRYLLNGGFLMVDDFWGDWEYQVLYDQIKRVFPDREPVELPIEHEIFHCVYSLKEKPQVPNIGAARAGRDRGITYETGHGPGAETVHFKAIFDDKNRIMVLICHNTDLGDGWEREGNDEWYFHNFCENKSYPMGINIVTYAMTH